MYSWLNLSCSIQKFQFGFRFHEIMKSYNDKPLFTAGHEWLPFLEDTVMCDSDRQQWHLAHRHVANHEPKLDI